MMSDRQIALRHHTEPADGSCTRIPSRIGSVAEAAPRKPHPTRRHLRQDCRTATDFL